MGLYAIQSPEPDDALGEMQVVLWSWSIGVCIWCQEHRPEREADQHGLYTRQGTGTPP